MRSRRPHTSLRVRLTLAFAAGMAVVLTGVAVFVYLNLRTDLRASVDSGLQSRAQVIAANAAHADPSLGGRRRLIDADEAFAQVLTPSGRIVETTPAVAGAALVPAGDLASLGRPTFVDDRPAGLDPSRLLIVPVTAAGHRVFVVVGATLSDSQEALDQALTRFAVAFPVALLLSSLIGWLLAGAALRPVERMRREAEAISASDPTRRLPVPRTDDTLARLADTLNVTFDRLQAALERERRFAWPCAPSSRAWGSASISPRRSPKPTGVPWRSIPRRNRRCLPSKCRWRKFASERLAGSFSRILYMAPMTSAGACAAEQAREQARLGVAPVAAFGWLVVVMLALCLLRRIASGGAPQTLGDLGNLVSALEAAEIVVIASFVPWRASLPRLSAAEAAATLVLLAVAMAAGRAGGDFPPRRCWRPGPCGGSAGGRRFGSPPSQRRSSFRNSRWQAGLSSACTTRSARSTRP